MQVIWYVGLREQGRSADATLCCLQSMPIEEQPFVSPVPPIRTKAPSSSPQGSTSRGSSRFQDRYTSPTTTRIVDELLDEVVAQRLTPRDMSGEDHHEFLRIPVHVMILT